MTYCIFSDLRHFEVVGQSEHLGTLHDIYFDDETWQLKWFVIDTGSWFSSNKVLLDSTQIQEVVPATRTVSVALTKQDIENAPSASEHPPVSEQSHGEYYYQAVTQNTLLVPGFSGLMMPTTLIERGALTRKLGDDPDDSASERGDRHLRSASEVEGYITSANDGNLGPLSDLVINTDGWQIELLALETGKWLPGRTVVVPPHSIEKISWRDRKLTVHMDKEAIRNSPELSDLKSIESSYMSRLSDYYRYPVTY